MSGPTPAPPAPPGFGAVDDPFGRPQIPSSGPNSYPQSAGPVGYDEFPGHGASMPGPHGPYGDGPAPRGEDPFDRPRPKRSTSPAQLLEKLPIPARFDRRTVIAVAVAFVALVAVLFLRGGGGDDSSIKQTVKQIEQWYAERDRPATATCPDDLPEEVGSSITCLVEFDDDTSPDEQAVVTLAAEGRFTWMPTPAPMPAESTTTTVPAPAGP